MGRPPKPLVTRQTAAQIALDLIDSGGLESFSVELVARAMGVRQSAIYYHFKNRDDLLAEAAGLLLRQIETPAAGPSTWADRQVKLGLATRRTILAHANAAPLILRYFPRRLLVAAYDLQLSDCPLPADRQMLFLEGTDKLVIGSALFAAQSIARQTSPMPDFDPERLPHLARAMDATPYDEETLFIESLWAFFNGFDLERPSGSTAALFIQVADAHERGVRERRQSP